MKKPIKIITALVVMLSMTACVAPVVNKKDYSAFRKLDPKSILIVPAVNKSVDVNAADYFLSTIVRPVAEKGYYVFPINLSKRIMEDDGLSDASLVHKSDTVRLASLFGADSVLYVTIERWDARYMIIATEVTVEFTYVLKNGHTGEQIWMGTQKMVYQPNQVNSGGGWAGLVIMAASAAIAKAAPNYIPLTQQANSLAVSVPHNGIPAGKYSSDYKKDMANF